MPHSNDSDSALHRRLEDLAYRALDARVTRIEPLAPGLGPRRFYRLRLDTAATPSVVARVDGAEDPTLRPVGVPAEPPLEPLRAFLASQGLPVPRCYAVEDGITLLEDAGDVSLERAVDTAPEAELRTLYREAVLWVPRLQALERPDATLAAYDRRLDAPLFAYKADQVVTWVLPWALGRAAKPDEAATVRDAFLWVAETCAAAPARLSHRDYKAANLHLRPGATEPGARLVMIDLQGAFLAPPEYDLVCLLRDSHVALPEPLVRELLDEVRPLLPDAPDAATFARRFALLTLTRNAKDLARYLYAANERGDRRYLELLPRAVETLRAAAALAGPWHPALRRLRVLIDAFPESSCAP